MYCCCFCCCWANERPESEGGKPLDNDCGSDESDVACTPSASGLLLLPPRPACAVAAAWRATAASTPRVGGFYLYPHGSSGGKLISTGKW